MSDSENRIDYIETPTKNVKATREFFEGLFGWSFKDFGPDYTAFDDGRMRGGFFKSDAPAWTKNGSVLTVFYVSNLESTERKVVELGGVILKPIYTFPGGRRFHFADPGGSEHAVWSE